jgi:hypothetical protein
VGSCTHRYAAAGDDGQGETHDVSGQREAICPVEAVLLDVVEIVGDEADVDRAFKPVAGGVDVGLIGKDLSVNHPVGNLAYQPEYSSSEHVA